MVGVVGVVRGLVSTPRTQTHGHSLPRTPTGHGGRHVPQPFQVHDLLSPLHLAPHHGQSVVTTLGRAPARPHVPPQGDPGGSRQLGTPRVRPGHWAPSHRLGGSREPPPKSPIPPPLATAYALYHACRHRVLEAIAGALQPHLRAGDTFVDFACALHHLPLPPTSSHYLSHLATAAACNPTRCSLPPPAASQLSSQHPRAAALTFPV